MFLHKSIVIDAQLLFSFCSEPSVRSLAHFFSGPDDPDCLLHLSQFQDFVNNGPFVYTITKQEKLIYSKRVEIAPEKEQEFLAFLTTQNEHKYFSAERERYKKEHEEKVAARLQLGCYATEEQKKGFFLNKK